MSDTSRRKPPVLNLKPFQSNTAPKERGFGGQEESTMITSLDEMQRSRAAQEYSLKAPFPTPDQPNAAPHIPPPIHANISPPNQSSVDPSSEQQAIDAEAYINTADDLEVAHLANHYTVPQEQTHQSPPSHTYETTNKELDVSLVNEADATSYTTPKQNLPQLLAFFNARGGVGATTTAIHVAQQLYLHQNKTILVDMDLQMCSIPACLDLTLERSLAEFVNESVQSNGPINSAIDHHASGVAVIAQDGRIHEIKDIAPNRLPRFYEALSYTYPFIIVDGIRSFSDHAVSVMDLATRIVLMVTQDVPAIRSARKALQLFDRLGYSSSKVYLVVNRFHKRASISIDMIEKSLKKEVDFTISNDFPFISQVISEGILANELKPKHKINREFRNLALQLVAQEDLIPDDRSWWQKLLRSKRS